MSFFKKLFGRKEEPKKEPIVQEEVPKEVEIEEEAEESIEETTEELVVEESVTGEEEEEAPIEEIQEAIEEAVEHTIMQATGVEGEEALEEMAEIIEEVILDTVVDESIEEDVPEDEEEVFETEMPEISVAEETSVEEEAEAIEVVAEPNEEKPKKKGLLNKLFSGLAKTRDNILGSVDEVLKNFKKIDEDLYEELEEALIMADFGVDTTLAIMEKLRALVKERKIVDPNELKSAIQEIITNILTAHETAPIIDETKPNVILVIGVNGVGKTTTIGKLSNQLKMDNKKVVLAAADTFRAAAIEQLQIWADRAHVDLIKHEEGSDPASVVYDGIKAAKSRKADVLICDTAGRLQNKANLMKELEKISRIIEREYPEAHKEVLIVLDATTGQNAISQVKVFKEAAKVDGIILTKLDGTAKGGAIVGICQSMGVPVKYIGVGEKIEDLQVFEPESFARALFNVE